MKENLSHLSLIQFDFQPILIKLHGKWKFVIFHRSNYNRLLFLRDSTL